jgi:SnoaL-like domain
MDIDEHDLARLRRLADQQEIRGIDRRDFDLVRGCYHPDATDDHGDFRGGVDDFIAYVQRTIVRFERTLHFIGNMLIEPLVDAARVESYAVAYHRIPASSSKPARDFVTGFRYVDDFERRAGEWRIATRVVAAEWSRLDPVGAGGWVPPAEATVGRADQGDVVFAPALRDWHP